MDVVACYIIIIYAPFPIMSKVFENKQFCCPYVLILLPVPYAINILSKMYNIFHILDMPKYHVNKLNASLPIQNCGTLLWKEEGIKQEVN